MFTKLRFIVNNLHRCNIDEHVTAMYRVEKINCITIRSPAIIRKQLVFFFTTQQVATPISRSFLRYRDAEK